IGSAQIVVEGTDASAVIQRQPFGVSFRDAGGRTVLSEVSPGAEPLHLPAGPAGPAGQPQGPGLYAPLAFLVGSDEPVAFGWRPEQSLREEGDVGNLEEDPESGTVYSA